VISTFDRQSVDLGEAETGRPELSVIIPCLNEAETVAGCVRTARQTVIEHGITAEIVVADNGSCDGSPELAEAAGARIVRVDRRGYGSALMGGIAAARGRYLIMGDADGSYDFAEIPRFLARLRSGDELVMGCRLPSGGGRIEPGAMPLLHRLLGNPALSMIARALFGAPIHDVYCGLRGFSKALADELRLRSPGMVFAAEMVARAGLFRRRISEVPITLHVDGRTVARSHLRTFSDGWETLCFFLMCCPRWLFLIPGLGLMLLGALGYGFAIPRHHLFRVTLDAHTLLVASLCFLLGYQSVLFAIFATTYGISAGLLPPRSWSRRLAERVNPGWGTAVGGLATVVGLSLIAVAFGHWRSSGYSNLDYGTEMRFVIPGVTLAALGFQTVLAGFFVGILKLGQR
jgi:hypothetical protein